MAYNNLNGIKLINGQPADLNAINKLIENDSFFKTEVDTDEDLSVLDRDITPIADKTYSLGSLAAAMKYIYGEIVTAEKLNLLSGSLGSPSLSLGSGISGIYSPATNHIGFASGVNRTLLLRPDGATIGAANNTQLTIESTDPGLEASWRLGGNSADFGFTYVGNTTTKALSLTEDAVLPLKQLLVTDGSVTAPAIGFASNTAMGLYKDGPVLSVAMNSADILKMSSEELKVLSSQILVKDGTRILPAISFQNAINTGFSTSLLDYIEVSVIGSLAALIRETGVSSISNFGATTGTKTFSDDESSTLSLERALGTLDLPVAITTGSTLGILRADGFIERVSGEDFYSYESAALEFIAQDDFTNLKSGGYVSVKTTPKNSIVSVERLSVGKDGKASVAVEGSLGIASTTITGPQTLLQVDVKDKSKLLITGTVEIKGFANGKEGQILHIVKLANTGTFTLLHNNATAVQSVWLKGSSTFTITSDFGGIILSFDNGQWREISRS